MKPKVLLINPSMRTIYKNTKVESSVPTYFPLNLLTIASPLLEKGYGVELLDLNFANDINSAIKNKIDAFKPEYVGITFTTPLFAQSKSIVNFIKELREDIRIIAGGVHVTSDYRNVMLSSKIDICVIGEGDYKLLEIIESDNLKKVKNIVYRERDKIVETEREKNEKNIDSIPFPALEIININSYKIPYTMCKANPVFPLETSRGCIFGCVYCNKSIFGQAFRVKSVDRVISDLKKIQAWGFREVHIMDDGFSTDINRAKMICRRIVQENINLYINCFNGIRADRIDLELLHLMKAAGIYSISFGVESGSQRIVDRINKRLSLEKVKEAFKMCRKVGIQTMAMFMLGLPDETTEDIRKTIRFAKELDADIAKFDIMIPLPSTPIFNEWKEQGYITSTDWNDYSFHSKKRVYNHPNLSWDEITQNLNLAYRSYYLRPSYLFKRLKKSLKDRTITKDIKTFLSVKWN